MIAAVIVVAVVVSSVLFIYYSPAYSWSSSIRDHDGDGVPDKQDAQPFNRWIWSASEGFINVTVYNNASEPVYFWVGRVDNNTVDDDSQIPTNAYGNWTRNVTVHWWNVKSTNVTLWVGANPGGYPTSYSMYFPMCGDNVNIINARTTTLHLTYPDDFILAYY